MLSLALTFGQIAIFLRTAYTITYGPSYKEAHWTLYKLFELNISVHRRSIFLTLTTLKELTDSSGPNAAKTPSLPRRTTTALQQAMSVTKS